MLIHTHTHPAALPHQSVLHVALLSFQNMVKRSFFSLLVAVYTRNVHSKIRSRRARISHRFSTHYTLEKRRSYKQRVKVMGHIRRGGGGCCEGRGRLRRPP